MYFCMRTTLDLDDELMRAAKQHAVETRRTLTSIVESALREFLRDDAEPPSPFTLEWPVSDGGIQAGVDITDRDSLIERMGDGS